jgi:succinyl-CoA synthetase beta subunit
MKLYEFQGKNIFKKYGIPVQSGKLIYPKDSLDNLTPPLVLKSQVLTGGRGKAGGIKLWDGKENVKKMIDELFNLKIKGEEVKALLALNSVDILRELYLSITFNKSKSTPVIIAGAAGGVDVENTVQKDKEQIRLVEFNSLLGISDFQIRLIAKKLKIEKFSELRRITLALYKIFKDLDASLVEINPLAITPDGLIAIDSKIELDDQAAFLHKELFAKLKQEITDIIGDDILVKSSEDTITYVPLSGNIGLLSDGAGTGLLSLDLLAKYGGKVANFCELGGTTSPEVVYKAMGKVHQDPNIKSILVVLIGGFNRMDEMAEGIARFCKDSSSNIPLFIRMCGTKEEEGKKIMEDANLYIYDDLHQAVKKAVKKAMES